MAAPNNASSRMRPANLAALFVEQQEDETQRELRAIKEQLARIEATLARLTDDSTSRP